GKAVIRSGGQVDEVSVRLPEGILGEQQMSQTTRALEDVYRGLYGRKGPDVPLEVIDWRVVASGPRPELKLKLAHAASGRRDARRASGRAYFPEMGGYSDLPAYDGYVLKPELQFAGPRLVEERGRPLVIGAGGRGRVD